MPIIFSTSSLALPGTLARFTGLGVLKNAAVALNPGGKITILLVNFQTVRLDVIFPKLFIALFYYIDLELG